MIFLATCILAPGTLLARPGQAGATAPPPSPGGEFSAAWAAGQPVVPLPPGSASRGEALFSGDVHLQNGGPACKACHSIAGIGFPNGGTLGPNLTGVYKKLGIHGMQVSMKTLYFRVMTPIYDPHPLTLQEQSDLIAFFKEAGAQTPPRWDTQIVALIAFIGFLILLAVSGFAWRDRIKPVRKTLVERAMRQGGRAS
ncbi:MAG: c-type cytochrome [Acidobacteriota bacterium]|nr:c-type cytochrome [Acidobacteriota bacterium]